MSKAVRILVTGSRKWKDRDRLYSILDSASKRFGEENLTIVHGDNKNGADAMANDWCLLNNITCEKHPAKWDEFGRKAGILRNIEMVDSGVDYCVAFFQEGEQNIGTSHCSGYAEKKKVKVIRID